ncbi:aromatic-ring hydroxylase C-terminal domain-containing protein [Streptomyces mooreae]|uniref:aromatic-ring hydroxylase C-terminal domain-containing protein n=1 Tax=Streptomyces mooreae TaxID=3075523 RepID=UPI00374DFF8A
MEAARTGVVGDVGSRTGAGAGDQGVATLCDHWGDLCPRFPDAAGWRDRLSTVLAAHPADRGDLSAVLIRPDGIVAWATAPDLPADTAAPATALRTWYGEPHTYGERPER